MWSVPGYEVEQQPAIYDLGAMHEVSGEDMHSGLREAAGKPVLPAELDSGR